MIFSKPGLILPKEFFQNTETIYLNQTSESMFVNFNETDRSLDLSVLDIVQNENNTVYIPSTLAKSILIDAKIVSLPKQKSLAQYVIPLKSEFDRLRLITVENIMPLAPNNVKLYLNNLLDFDLISKETLVYIPRQSYRFNGVNAGWYNNSVINSKSNHGLYYISDSNQKTIDLKSVVHYSNNRPLNEKELHRIKQMLQNEDTFNLAIEIINVLNPELSYIELLLAFNAIPSFHKIKNKKTTLPLMQELYNFDIKTESYNLNSIVNLYKLYFDKEPSQKQLEFITDNYISNYNEKCNYFEFKLTIKNK